MMATEMTPSELIAAGERLFGKYWRKPLAITLRINVSTLRRWATGKVPITPIAALAIEQLVRDKRRARRQPR
jgi:hypothetical protein